MIKTLKLVLVLIFITDSDCYSQNTDTVDFEILEPVPWEFPDTLLKLELEVDCPYTIQNAKNDIKSGTIKLVIKGGFNGFGYINKKELNKFQENYNVIFEYLACFRPWDVSKEDVEGYNNTIMNYLVSKNGQKVSEQYHNIFIEQ